MCYEAWLRIQAEQLRELPAEAWDLPAHQPVERKVAGDLTVTLRHPRLKVRAVYAVGGLPGVEVGAKVELQPLLMSAEGEAFVRYRHQGELAEQRVLPVEQDDLGTPVTATTWGEYRARPRYPLAVRGFWLNRGVMVFHVIPIFFSGGLVPTYLVYRSLGMVDTMWVMVLPGAIAVFTTVVFRTYFLGLGTELREAAHIDGANDLYILFRIYLPLSKPVIAFGALFQIVLIWNDFFRPLLFINEEELKPLTLFLRRLLVQVDVQSLREQMERSIMERERQQPVPVQAFQAASIIVSIVPIICIYPFIQRYFVKGALIGSLR